MHFPTLYPSLLSTQPHPNCRVSVIVPARNEEHALPATLDALRVQVDMNGVAIKRSLYEVIVLLNNCTDDSGSSVRSYQQQHPDFSLHCAERLLAPEVAHVGTARRMLMDTAYRRLADSKYQDATILSTDADTQVAPEWIYRNLRAIRAGAEVVGGVIHLTAQDAGSLNAGTLAAYRADRAYQQNVARLESLLDPDSADPWPRHLEHFGASLACTPEVYRRSGGLPAVDRLEDVAFVDALRRVDARIRHAPDVCVYTSARLHGRADVGFSSQLRLWQRAAEVGQLQIVDSAEWLAHRFSRLAQLRCLGALDDLPSLAHYPECWHDPLRDHHPRRLSPSAFLCAIDCDRLINETFDGRREDDVVHATKVLGQMIISFTRRRFSYEEVFASFEGFPRAEAIFSRNPSPELEMAELAPSGAWRN